MEHNGNRYYFKYATRLCWHMQANYVLKFTSAFEKSSMSLYFASPGPLPMRRAGYATCALVINVPSRISLRFLRAMFRRIVVIGPYL